MCYIFLAEKLIKIAAFKVLMAITINPKVAHGKPTIAGTRITVELILELLSSGMSVDNILKEYPHLTREQVLEAIKYAQAAVKHDEIIPFSSEALA